MLREVNQVQRYFGARFGRNNIPDGIYAIPTDTKHGKAFMKMEIKNIEYAGKENFHLFWDEALTIKWEGTPKPDKLPKESKIAKAFRAMEKATNTYS